MRWASEAQCVYAEGGWGGWLSRADEAPIPTLRKQWAKCHMSAVSPCVTHLLYKLLRGSQRWPWRKIRIQNPESHIRNMPGPEFPDWQALVHGNTVNRSQMNREMGSFSWAHPKSLYLLPPPASSLNPFSSHLPSIWCQQGLKCLRMDSPAHTHIQSLSLLLPQTAGPWPRGVQT